MVDSIGKKIKVVEEIASELNLTNVLAEHNRAEKINKRYHFVTNRAVTRLTNMLPWVNNKFLDESISSEFSNGLISLKGGDLVEELEEARLPYQKWDIKDFFKDPFFDTKSVVYIPFSN